MLICRQSGIVPGMRLEMCFLYTSVHESRSNYLIDAVAFIAAFTKLDLQTLGLII